MEAIVPQKSSREYESGRSERVRVINLMPQQRVLSVKHSKVEGLPSVKVIDDMLEKLRMFWIPLSREIQCI